MKANYVISTFLIISFVAGSKFQDFIDEGNRRILHQPLFPYTSSPPPPPPQPKPLPPPSPEQDQPFFHELPNGPAVEQTPPSTTTSSSTAAAPHRSNSIKKVAVAISSAIMSLALLSAVAFYLYKRRIKHRNESGKLVGGRLNEESRVPPSTFLYIGTVEPSATSIASEANDASASPYGKLNSGKRYNRYRPSPDLQPLPPLTKPPSIASPPPPVSSSDDDEGSHETNFYTPQGSSMSIDSHCSRNSNNTIGQINHQTRGEDRLAPPHSKRTSPKSRLSASSPPVIIPSIKQGRPPSPPPPPPPASSLLGLSKPLSYTPQRTKFPPPPPPPDMVRLQSISNYESASPVPPAPPPPPPPPQLMKFGDVQKQRPSPVSDEVIIKPQPKSPTKKPTEDKLHESRPKLKPLHWDKVRATSDRVTVWDQLNSSSFQLNEDAMESLFGCNSANSVPKEASKKSGLPAVEQEMRVLDPKKSQNLAILLRALNVTREEVAEALLDGNPEGLGPDLLETLVKMAPTKEEEIKLKDCKGEISKLGPAERFLKAILDIPFAFKRVEAMLYRANFHAEVAYLRNSFQTLDEASEELKNSRMFLKLLEAVLRTGNRMNDGTNRGDARAFKLETLLKLVDVKGTDGKTTLLHFVVQEMIRSEGPASQSQMNKEEEFKKQGLHKTLDGVQFAARLNLYLYKFLILDSLV